MTQINQGVGTKPSGATWVPFRHPFGEIPLVLEDMEVLFLMC